jgi:pilus assembly protein Flp/PilA
MLDYLRAVIGVYLPQRDERGASAVEYGLLIAGIAALVVVIVFAFGDNIRDIFENTCKQVANGGASTGTCAKD